jgi:hypothetical protein
LKPILPRGRQPFGDAQAQVQTDSIGELKRSNRVSVSEGQEGIQVFCAGHTGFQ